jgi:hypothetical protein
MYLPTRPACHEVPHARMMTLRRLFSFSRDVQVLEEDLAAIERHAAEDGVARGGRLLVDLLEHEVLVAALLRRDRIPQHALRGLRHSRPCSR